MSYANPKIDRRTLLQAGAAGVAAVAAADILAACGGGAGTGGAGSASIGASSAGEGTPVRGGVFTVGMISGGPAETLAPALISAYVDTLRGYQLYNPLFIQDEKGQLGPCLALSGEPNKTYTEWTLKLRDGVVWHDGKPFNADDVVHSFREWGSPENFGHYLMAGLVNFNAVKKTGPLEVRVPLTQPVGDFPSLVATYNNFVVQAGSTVASFKSNPVGTGPFKYVSFIPGKQSVFAANENYWEQGKPYVDELIVDSSFTDENARLNALLSGKINVLPLLSFNQAHAESGNSKIKVLAGPGLGSYQFAMAVDKPPFDDPKVREALSLSLDRQALIDGSLAGLGEVGNNIFGGFDKVHVPYFATQLEAEHDPEKAKSLLKAAGKEGLSFELPIAEAGPGYAEAATLFAEQAKAAGINVSLQNIPVSQYFAVIPGGYLSRPIQVSASFPYASLAAWYRAFLTSGSPLAESHWGTPAHDKEINRAIAAPPDMAEEAWLPVQEKQFKEGGELVFAYPYWVDGCASNVYGLKESPSLYLNNARLCDGWIGE